MNVPIFSGLDQWFRKNKFFIHDIHCAKRRFQRCVCSFRSETSDSRRSNLRKSIFLISAWYLASLAAFSFKFGQGLIEIYSPIIHKQELCQRHPKHWETLARLSRVFSFSKHFPFILHWIRKGYWYFVSILDGKFLSDRPFCSSPLRNPQYNDGTDPPKLLFLGFRSSSFTQLDPPCYLIHSFEDSDISFRV